jgi:hypothetical protein
MQRRGCLAACRIDCSEAVVQTLAGGQQKSVFTFLRVPCGRIVLPDLQVTLSVTMNLRSFGGDSNQAKPEPV